MNILVVYVVLIGGFKEDTVGDDFASILVKVAVVAWL